MFERSPAIVREGRKLPTMVYVDLAGLTDFISRQIEHQWTWNCRRPQGLENELVGMD